MSTASRFPAGFKKNVDNTSRNITNEYQAPSYAASIALVTKAGKTVVNVGALTGALTITAGVGSSTTAPFVGDKLEILFAASGADRTVTFSTGFAVSAATLVVVNAKYGSITCTFNGVAWVEVARSLTA